MSIIVSLIALFIFALFDYFGYTYFYFLSKVKLYRVLQGVFQATLTILCLLFGGIKAAIIFNLLWWTWSADWIFYLYCLIFNFRGNRRDWLQPFRGYVRWAFWTPVGLTQLLFKGKEKVRISENEYKKHYRIIKPAALIIQSVIGAVLSVLVYYYL
ncbi:MAG: hypothetical protein JW917_08775 [Ignavibacteria bacterium]|nr:hypothetical protein [Ignavibacteria bacterium]